MYLIFLIFKTIFVPSVWPTGRRIFRFVIVLFLRTACYILTAAAVARAAFVRTTGEHTTVVVFNALTGGDLRYPISLQRTVFFVSQEVLVSCSGQSDRSSDCRVGASARMPHNITVKHTVNCWITCVFRPSNSLSTATSRRRRDEKYPHSIDTFVFARNLSNDDVWFLYALIDVCVCCTLGFHAGVHRTRYIYLSPGQTDVHLLVSEICIVSKKTPLLDDLLGASFCFLTTGDCSLNPCSSDRGVARRYIRLPEILHCVSSENLLLYDVCVCVYLINGKLHGGHTATNERVVGSTDNWWWWSIVVIKIHLIRATKAEGFERIALTIVLAPTRLSVYNKCLPIGWFVCAWVLIKEKDTGRKTNWDNRTLRTANDERGREMENHNNKSTWCII